jgi:N-methylhydantoinase A
LGYPGERGVIEMAEGSLAIATITMAGAIRRVSIEHGLDPRDFVLFSYGGCGPLHASALAHELAIPTVIIPPEPGNFSAIGMLLADARIDAAKTFAGLLDDRTVEEIEKHFRAMEQEAAASLRRDFGAGEIFFERYAEMRFKGQRHNIKVPITGLRDAAAIHDAFTRDYKRRYGHADSKAPAELQALLVSAFAKLRRPDIACLPRRAGAAQIDTSRLVYFGKDGGLVATRVYDRDALKPGFAAAGPAVIEEYGSTTLVWPGDRFEVGPLGEIRIACRKEAR